jgi:hypothetical protein
MWVELMPVVAVIVVETGLLERVRRGVDLMVIADQLLVEDVRGYPNIKTEPFRMIRP